MMSIGDITQTTGWKKFMAKLYGFGATVVILGAMFKITHWPGGTFMIVFGLSVEAVIFFFSAFEPLHEELDWTLVYPELAGMSDPDEIEIFRENAMDPGGNRPLEKIEDILGVSGMDNEVMKKVSEGFQKLGDSAQGLAEISGATVATKDFVTNLQTASTAVSSMHETYTASTDTIKESATSLSSAYFETADNIKKSGGEIAQSYKEIAGSILDGHKNIVSGNSEYENQLKALSTNLSGLNDIYKNQIDETSQQLKGSKELYTGLHEMISNLRSSVEETNEYNQEITKLKESISSLNGIYGNMLNAMSSAKKKA